MRMHHIDSQSFVDCGNTYSRFRTTDWSLVDCRHCLKKKGDVL